MKINKQNPKRYCNQCGSYLLLVKESVENREYSSPVTTIIYRCSDKSCQADIDRKEMERKRHNKKQEQLRARRYAR